MVVRVEGCGLVVVDAQGGQGASEHEGLLQLQLSPLDVVSSSCTAMYHANGVHPSAGTMTSG